MLTKLIASSLMSLDVLVLWQLTFRGNSEFDIIFEEDRSQRNPDGSFAQINTGVVRGIVVMIHSSVQHQTLFTIADMSETGNEDLGLKYRGRMNQKILSLRIPFNRNDIFKLLLLKLRRKQEELLSKENKSAEQKEN